MATWFAVSVLSLLGAGCTNEQAAREELPDAMPRLSFPTVSTITTDGVVSLDPTGLPEVVDIAVVEGSPPTPDGAVLWRISSESESGTAIESPIQLGSTPPAGFVEVQAPSGAQDDWGLFTVVVIGADETAYSSYSE